MYSDKLIQSLSEMVNVFGRQAKIQEQKIQELEAEIARLLKALKEIAGTSDSDFMGKWVSEYHLRDIARAALEGK